MVSVSDYLEGLIDDCGGFGLYQVLISIVLLCAKLSVTWTVLMMSFAGAIPNWWCYQNSTLQYTLNNSSSFKSCMADNTTQCDYFTYEQSMHTVVSEFDLVCNKDWVVATVTTIQMGGLLVGCFVSGHLADFVGRKPVFYLSLFVLCVMNLVAYFSISWKMFAVVRFCLGFGSGAYITVYFPLLVEFISTGKRPIIAGLPSWTLWAAAMGLAAYLLPNWSHLHLATAIFTAPWLLTWWFIPESFRWLVSNKKYKEAEEVIKKMARMNKAPIPDLSKMETVLSKEEETQQRYSVLDLFRGKHLIKNTLLHAVMWFSCGYVYYAISFGVQKLSGSLYLNMFLLSAVEIPGNAITIFTSNLFGRKWTSCGFFLLSGLASLVVASVQTVQLDEDLSGKLINIFALTSKLCVGAGWCSLAVLTSEVYPTVIRNIGYGFQNTATRVGAMVAPQMVFLGNRYTGILYYLSGALMLCSCLCAFFSSETRGIVLADTLDTKQVKQIKPDVTGHVISTGDAALSHMLSGIPVIGKDNNAFNTNKEKDLFHITKL